MAQILLLIGVCIFGLLGTVHLLYTFFSNKFMPFDLDVMEAMQSTSPRITKQTTMWRAWLGLNASHSAGAILLAAIYVPLTLDYYFVIQSSMWLSLLPVVVGCFYLFLAKQYWFNIPLIGISLALICFIAAAWMTNY